MLRFLGWTGLIIFLIGLLVVLGLLKLIFKPCASACTAWAEPCRDPLAIMTL
ncbi:hypothetical protein ACFQ4K_05875 [Tistrella bauzanensis]